MITWYKRLKDWEKLVIAVILGISGTLSLRAWNNFSFRQLSNECDRLHAEVDKARYEELDYKFAEYSQCLDKMYERSFP